MPARELNAASQSLEDDVIVFGVKGWPAMSMGQRSAPTDRHTG